MNIKPNTTYTAKLAGTSEIHTILGIDKEKGKVLSKELGLASLKAYKNFAQRGPRTEQEQAAIKKLHTLNWN